jgi:metal-responsive CopG/Arc/MetJ family transcriptional regulator
MSKKAIISVRIPESLLDEINEDAEDLGISQADWIRDALETYLTLDENDDDDDDDDDDDV